MGFGSADRSTWWSWIVRILMGSAAPTAPHRNGVDWSLYSSNSPALEYVLFTCGGKPHGLLKIKALAYVCFSAQVESTYHYGGAALPHLMHVLGQVAGLLPTSICSVQPYGTADTLRTLNIKVVFSSSACSLERPLPQDFVTGTTAKVGCSLALSVWWLCLSDMVAAHLYVMVGSATVAATN
jgi:hypothetical protein